MKCQDAQPLIQGYLDGELSEAQAGPLRKHLLACTGCRNTTQDGKALKEWFVDGEPLEIPSGFAARVARRAFAGDRGQDLTPGSANSAADEGRILPFVLQLTAIAAALLMAFSIGIRTVDLPSTGELHADDASKESVLQEFDRLNSTPEEAPLGEAGPESRPDGTASDPDEGGE